MVPLACYFRAEFAGHPVPRAPVEARHPAGRAAGRSGRRLVYGGYVISLSLALLFNGLANVFKVAAPQRRPPYRADICQRYDLCAVQGVGKAPAFASRRPRSAAHPHGGRPSNRGQGVEESAALDAEGAADRRLRGGAVQRRDHRAEFLKGFHVVVRQRTQALAELTAAGTAGGPR